MRGVVHDGTGGREWSRSATGTGAAAVPEVFVTAFDAVWRRAGLAGGDTLLGTGATTTLRRPRPEQKADLIQEFGRRAQLAEGKPMPLIDRVFDLNDAADGLDQVRVPAGKFRKLLLTTSRAEERPCRR